MTKLTYTNDQQIINDAAQMLIEAHLRWSGSTEGKPSNDYDYVAGQMFDAYREANFGIHEWRGMPTEGREAVEKTLASLYEQAAKIADSKWQAAMVLLGIEQ